MIFERMPVTGEVRAQARRDAARVRRLVRLERAEMSLETLAQRARPRAAVDELETHERVAAGEDDDGSEWRRKLSGFEPHDEVLRWEARGFMASFGFRRWRER